MKTSLIIAITTAVILTFGNIFSTHKVPQSILVAIENGDAENLAIYFNQNIDLQIVEKSGIFNKNQAEILVNDFFEINKPILFEVVQQKEQINSSFAICEFENAIGEKYGIYILVRKFRGENVITKLKIKYL